MSTTNNQQNKKCPNVKEVPKKVVITNKAVVKCPPPKQHSNSNEKSYDDTLKNVDELPEDDESIRNAVEPKK
uniref:Uncharacterized protein n=1 Tax=Parastrongyloides trichosuri TaxID=131310 RepID=A0A0N4ZYN6_PARTI